MSLGFGNLFWGFATSLYSAMLCRFLFMGALNGWATVMGPMCLEVGGEARQANVFAQILGWGTAAFALAPAVGAFVYGTFGMRFPALFPGIIGFIIGMTGAVTVHLWLPDMRKSDDKAANAASSHAQQEASVWQALSTRPLPLITLLRGLHGMVAFAVLESNPLFFIGSEDAGGLGMPKPSVGIVLAGSVVILWAFATFAQAKLVNNIGFRRSCYLGGLFSGCAVASMPFVGAWPPTRLPLIIIALAVHLSAIGVAQAGIYGLCNVAVAEYAPIKGTLNGIVTTFEAFAKAMGPATASPLIAFALSISATRTLYLCLGTFIAGTLLLGWYLPTKIEKRVVPAATPVVAVPPSRELEMKAAEAT